MAATSGGALSSVFSQQEPSGLIRRELVFDTIVSEDPDDLLNQSSDAIRKALEWIIDEETLVLPTNQSGIMQRFILAHFYFATSTNGAWRTCSPPLQNDTCSLTKKRWLTRTTECTWAGVICSSKGHVVTMSCSAFGLTGVLPDSMVLLLNLQQLVLPNNELGGSMPQTLPSGLTMLSLRNNSITGPLSPAVTALSDLRILDLSGNSISGSIPSQMN